MSGDEDPYESLSDDNHVAFMQLEREFRTELEMLQESNNSNWEYITADYMNKTLAAARALEIEALSAFTVNTREDSGHGQNFNEFLRAVDSLVVQMRIYNARRRNGMSVGLNDQQKTKIHALIEKIRVLVEESNAVVSKKEKLFGILASLAEEVSKARTKFERFGDLARGLAGLSKDIQKEGAEPWWPWFKAIMGVVDDAKEAEPQLPKPPEIKRIEPPNKKLPKPGRSDLDDEIPF
jgi:hypothetical protein